MANRKRDCLLPNTGVWAPVMLSRRAQPPPTSSARWGSRSRSRQNRCRWNHPQQWDGEGLKRSKGLKVSGLRSRLSSRCDDVARRRKTSFLPEVHPERHVTPFFTYHLAYHLYLALMQPRNSRNRWGRMMVDEHHGLPSSIAFMSARSYVPCVPLKNHSRRPERDSEGPLAPDSKLQA